jgi:(2Fe-2S) ferredoxin
VKRLDINSYDAHLFVCQGSKCGKHGGKEIYKDLRHLFKHQELPVYVSRADCFDECKNACVVVLEGPDSVWWGEVKPKHVDRIAEKVIESLLEQRRLKEREKPLHDDDSSPSQ